jgi:hypothetical protein
MTIVRGLISQNMRGYKHDFTHLFLHPQVDTNINIPSIFPFIISHYIPIFPLNPHYTINIPSIVPFIFRSNPHKRPPFYNWLVVYLPL